jgi:hypothetical protein
MSNSLYNLTNEFIAAMDNINDLIEEGMDISERAYADTLEMLQMPLEEKAENIVKYMKSLEALADAKKLEAKRLSEAASKDLKKAESLKAYMADNLKKANITKLQAGIFSLGWRKGTEVVKVNEEEVPTSVQTIAKHFNLREPQPDKVISKTELKKILKENPEIKIPGVSIVRNPDSLVVK